MRRKYRRVGFTAAQSAELWERWKKGEGLKSIGRVFGKPIIPTPALDQIAADGLRYTQFHSTALCSPTRAALITGRNHHVEAVAKADCPPSTPVRQNHRIEEGRISGSS